MKIGEKTGTDDSAGVEKITGAAVSWKRGLLGLSPVVLFLLLYVVVSLCVGDFYKMPFSVALLVASAWGVALCGGSLAKRVEVYSKAAAHSNIIYMIWIFILAGSFAALARDIGAVDATVSLALRILPASMVVPGLFVAACFISLAVGTSVGTVVALTPLAVEMAGVAGGNVGYMIAVVLGGAFFGDNLSFISDTTVAATRSQGCRMDEKFRANIRIALPAALVTLALYIFQSGSVERIPDAEASTDYVLVVPYLIVIVTALLRVNVTLVLMLGLLSAFVIGLCKGIVPLDLCGYAGAGIESMGSLIVITLMSAGMLGIVRKLGGIAWLLQALSSRVKGRKGAEVCVALLVGAVNLCTANNTVAIITVGSLSREISSRFGIVPRRAASILDTSSCIVQCLIPYGAQTLLATGLAGVSPTAPFAYLYYPWALTVAVAAAIALSGRNRSNGIK